MSITFLRSCYSMSDLPAEEKPEVAFIGRSNVGKSSLINAIAGRKQLAKVSSTPGKTQSLNFYNVEDAFFLVDMPGYGYSQTAKTNQEKWEKLTEEYFSTRKNLRAIALLVDSRHVGLANDRAVIEWFSSQKLPFFIVLTKTDKINQSAAAKHEKELRSLGTPEVKIYKTSAEKGKGIKELMRDISEMVQE